MKRILAATLLFLAAGYAQAQVLYTVNVPKGARTIAQAQTSTTAGDVAMYCKYIGSSACASIAVDAGTGDLTFTEGTCGSEAATSTFECPVSGALGGVIDVSNAACNTIGEVVNIVNTTSSGWRCLPFGALLADSSNDTIATISATQATGPDGLALYFDDAVTFGASIVLSPVTNDGGSSARGYSKLSTGPFATTFLQKPYANPAKQALLQSAQITTTYGSGTSAFSVIAVDRTFGTTSSETSYTIWPSTALGATTVAKTFGSCDTPATGCDPAWGPSGLLCPAGMQCILRVANSEALSAITAGVSGLYWDAPVGGLQ